MNSDGSRGVASELSIGAELDAALWVGIVLLVVGALLAALAALAITAGARRGRQPLAPPADRSLTARGVAAANVGRWVSRTPLGRTALAKGATGPGGKR